MSFTVRRAMHQSPKSTREPIEFAVPRLIVVIRQRYESTAKAQHLQYARREDFITFEIVPLVKTQISNKLPNVSRLLRRSSDHHIDTTSFEECIVRKDTLEMWY